MKKEIFTNKKIPIYFIYFFIIYILHILFFRDLKFFLFITYSIRALMGLVVMVISINTYKISHNTIFTFLAISLGLAGVLDSLSVVTTYHHSLSSILNELLYIRMFSDFLALFSLILCTKIHDKNFNLRRLFLIYSAVISLLVLLFSILLFVFRIFPSINSKLILHFSIQDIFNFSFFVLYLYPVYMFFRIKDSIKDNDLKHIFLLSILPAISMIFFFLESLKLFLVFFSFAGNIILLFHLFFVCRIILNAVLKEPYKMLFYDLNNKSNEIKKIKHYYETLIESLPLAIIIILNNKVSFTNLATLELFNYKSKYDIFDIDLYDILSDKSICSFADNIYNEVDTFETVFKKSNGELFPARVTPTDIVFHGDECTMFIIKDISTKKKVRELSQNLEQKIREEKIKTDFFSNISHELRTPINVMYSVLQLEDIYLKEGNLEAIAKHNKILKQNCLRLLRICNNIIDSSKIETGCFVPNMKYANMVNLIENIIDSVSTYISTKNMTITFDTDSEEIYSVCDGDLIERIILNLISNSMKYGNEYGNMQVNMYDEGDFLKIIFMDDGPGIDKEKCENIFKRFVQVDKSFSRPSEGSGVGLSLVKSLIDMHDGTIDVESDKGLGCKFTIMIPAVKCYLDEVAMASEPSFEDNSIIDKINIEFSDIYF